MKRRPIPTCTDSSGTIHTLRRAPDGEELTAADRLALLADVRGNPGSTAELTIVARVYRQTDTPNRNFVRFRSEALADVCASFAGAPFLRDHDQGDLLARGGTARSAEMVTEPDGVAFQLAIDLVKPWAIEAALDGTLDRFSIGWRAVGDVTCTACGVAFERGFFGLVPRCDHELGETYTVKGAKVIAQAEFSGAEGVEVSGVSVPAVHGTSIDAIRAALAAGDTFNPGALCAALALAPTESKEVVRAVFEAQQAELKVSQAREREARAQLQAHEVEHLIADALRSGRMVPGSDFERAVRTAAATSIDTARSLLSSIPRNFYTPVGSPMLSAGPDPRPRGPEMSVEQAHVNALLGITDEAYARSLARKEK